MDFDLKTETTTIRKGYKIHFIKSDRVELITKTHKAGNPYEGELWTDKNEEGYSVDFIKRYLNFGFAKIYKK